MLCELCGKLAVASFGQNSGKTTKSAGETGNLYRIMRAVSVLRGKLSDNGNISRNCSAELQWPDVDLKTPASRDRGTGDLGSP